MAYAFAATNGNIIVTSLTTSSTISAWHIIARRNLSTGGNRIIDKQNSGSVVEFIFSPGDGKFGYTRGWSGGNVEWRGGSFPNETLTRAIIIYDGGDTANAPIIYQASGGAVTATAMTIQSGTVSGTLNTNSDAYTIGNRQNSSANRPWSDWLAEIAHWTDWLSMEAIGDMLLRDKSPAWYATNRNLYVDCIATVNDYDGSTPTVTGATEDAASHPILLRPAGYGGIIVSAGADQSIIDTDENGSESVVFDGTVTADAKGTVTSNTWYLDYVDETNAGTSLSTSIDPTLALDVGHNWVTLRALSSKNVVTTSTVAIVIRDPADTVLLDRHVIRHWFYNDALDGTAFSTIAANYDRLTSTAARESSLNTWYSAKSGEAASERSPGMYILAAEARSADPKWENNVLHSGNPDTYAAYLAANPAHFLYSNSTGTVLGGTNKKMYHGHAGVPDYLILNLDRTPSGGDYGLRTRDGGGAVSWQDANSPVFLDNVFQRWNHLSVSVIYNSAGQRLFLSTTEYVNAWERYLRLMYAEYGLDNGGPGLWANIADLTSADPDLIKSIWKRYSRYLDGYMHEAFATGYDLETYSVAKQTLYVELVEQAIALGKYILCVAQTNDVDNATRQRYALAVFMLIADSKYASFRYTSANNNGAGYTDYHTYRLYTNEDLDLGTPSGARTNPSGNWWRRTYSSGYSSALFGSASSCHIVEVGDNTYGYEVSEVVSQQLAVTDYSTSALTYARTGGDAWPTGLSLSSGGLLSGTITGAAGEYDVNVTVTDSDGGTFEFPVALTVTQDAVAPVLAAIGNQTVAEGDSDEVNLSATDENGGLLVFSIDGEPDFVSLLDNEDGTATLTIAPDYTDAGVYNNITVTVTDNTDLTDSETFSITVTDTNRPPVLAAIGPREGYEGDPLTFNISASDPDGAAVSFQVDDLPGFGTFEDNEDGTATFTFNPTFDDSGEYQITVTVTEDTLDALTDDETFTLTINEIGRSPVLAAIGNRSVRAGKTLIIELSATDPDGDNLAFTEVEMPEFGTLDDHGDGTATLTFAPGAYEDDGGEYNMTIIVTDDSLEENTDSETFTLTVLEPAAAGAAGDTAIPYGPYVAEPLAFSHTINDMNEDDTMARYIPQCYASQAGNLGTTAQSLIQLGFSADQVAQATTCVISIADQDILYRTAPDAAVPVISPQAGIHVAADTGVPVVINANAGTNSDIARLRLIALTGTARWTIQLYG